MCKTPVVTFNIGIATDIIKDNRSGYIAKNFDPLDFSKGILKFLTNHNYIENIDKSIINKLTIKNQALQYRELFEDLL